MVKERCSLAGWTAVSGCDGWQADGGIIAQRSDSFPAHVAGAPHGPLIILFEQQRTDEPDDSSLVGEDADHVAAPLHLLLLYPGRSRREQHLNLLHVLGCFLAFAANRCVLREQPSLRARTRTPAQDGVWAGAEGCFLIRGIRSRTKRCGPPKKWNALSPAPSPEGPRQPRWLRGRS
jgi:hypothetical protein